MAKSKKFPRTLYKKSETGKFSFTTTQKGKGKVTVKYDSVIVNNEEEMEVSVDELGYRDSFASILTEYGDEEEVTNEEEF